eukprot:TRINITY_DN481_c0_g1_i2.p1 TRINITY_DN481_c0_g1~~TRINITY_DN481_c0_g1_i2.p1  ORF type:complete len:504 (+),score=80.54 TRINITY_DN481_c0_g1_i2:56-1567(+)
MEFTWFAVAGTVSLLILMFLYKIGAKHPPGLPVHSKQESFWGTTRTILKNVLKNKEQALVEFNIDEFERNGWKAYGWGAIGGKVGINIVDPRDVKFLLKDQFSNFVKGPEFIDNFHCIIGKGIFNVNGSEWKAQRVIAAQMFNRRQLSERMSQVFGSHAQDVVQEMKLNAEKGVLEFDIQEYFYRYTFDAINSVAFNRDVNALKGKQDDVDFMNAFHKVQDIVPTRFIDPLWKIHRIFQSSETERQISECLKTVNSYVYKVADDYLSEDLDLADDRTMTGLFIQHSKDEGIEVDRDFIKDLIMNFVLAGRDTTSSGLASTIWMLCKHPEWQEKLIAEAASIFSNMRIEDPLTFDDVADGKAPVSRAVFMEALRMFPPVAGNEKVAVETTTFPSGFTINAGTKISWFPMATNRHPEHWTHPNDFYPERWMDGSCQGLSDYLYATFNAGPRLCLGKDMAILEAQILLLTMFANFRFTLKPGFEPRGASGVTWQYEEGVVVRMEYL